MMMMYQKYYHCLLDMRAVKPARDRMQRVAVELEVGLTLAFRRPLLATNMPAPCGFGCCDCCCPPLAGMLTHTQASSERRQSEPGADSHLLLLLLLPNRQHPLSQLGCQAGGRKFPSNGS